ncbi:BON domain-containing protein [Pseudoduganella rivuli]|uniref:BON domain-containing protein n=1 Tax=Pseudoduganella rivuli TaxID=2666085 RepID=UPI001E4DD3C5|nr:BON domain-containing protein [Pseudoduganella rivuli]
MNKFLILALAGALSNAYAADNDKAAYDAAKDKATADYKAAKAQCKSLKGNAEDICIEEAKVARARAEADAVAQHKTGDVKDLRKAREDVAKAEYDLAKEKCDDQSGNAKKACKLDAKAAKESAIADAKRADPTPTIGERTAAAVDTTRDRTTTAVDTTRDRTATATTTTATDAARNTTAAAGDVMSDTMITTKVKADLAADPAVKAMDVHVETVKGVVMLSGFVPSKSEADKAVQLARGVKGVTEVKSSIQVKK